MIKLKNLLMENGDEDGGQIDVDRLYWHDSYLDDVLEKLGYNRDFNANFWHHPHPLYHCTPPENAESIQQNGIRPSSATRGISNRSVGSAVFTTMESEEVGSLQQSYGASVFIIDTKAMKTSGYTPEVSQEPEWEKAEKLAFVLNKLGRDIEPAQLVDSSDGVTPSTVIVYGSIPPQFIRKME